jgi:ketosteroid isomerase-like protein|tara:strand:+ start:139 stop:543 length:405 start_codon:yes stop_codon:yes gene_type:complete
MLDLEQEKQELLDLDQAWIDADSVEEVERFLSDDIVIMPPDEALISGKEAVLKWYADSFEVTDLSDEPQREEGSPDYVFISKARDMAYTTGRVNLVVTSEDESDPFTEDVKYMICYNKEHGVWKGKLGIFNSNI